MSRERIVRIFVILFCFIKNVNSLSGPKFDTDHDVTKISGLAASRNVCFAALEQKYVDAALELRLISPRPSWTITMDFETVFTLRVIIFLYLYALKFKATDRYTRLFFQMHYTCPLQIFNEILWFNKVDTVNKVAVSEVQNLNRSKWTFMLCVFSSKCYLTFKIET